MTKFNRCKKCFDHNSNNNLYFCPKFIFNDKIKLLYCSYCANNTPHTLELCKNNYYKCISHNKY